ncbi:MFS transporter [Streptacidiphilus monticola]|uniref:MFS transporter n=1 Tax=Streptacidiphilus monticola TaxID=2161674 RepID=A0ABW1G8R9_9ACTN
MAEQSQGGADGGRIDALRRAGASAHRTVSATAERTGKMVHATGRRIRKATSAEGAGETGLAKLIELQAVSSAGDMMITVALASTIFFSVPTDQARGRVALYLLITMAPFVLLAPLIGPMLDRIPSGRRAAMAGTMLVRAALAWMMAGSISGGGLSIYPEALGVLVASKANGVVRSVVVPRLLPPQLPNVKANSRVTLAGLIATGLAGGVGGLLHLIGPAWPLRGAFLLFVIATGLALALPHQVDSAKGEQRAVLHEDRPKANFRSVGPAVVMALRAEGTLRGLFGFLTFFLAFLVRAHPMSGLAAGLELAVMAGALGVGNTLGTVLGSWLRSRRPEVIVTAMLVLATAAAVVATVFYGLLTVTLLAGVAGLAQSLGKVALDALIQRDVPEVVRTSAFARSETLMQLTWVVGGGLGIVLPLVGQVGTATASALLALSLIWTFRSLWRLPSAGHRGAVATPDVA